MVENPKNNNKHPDRQIELLAKIIDYQGQRSPIVISKRSGFVVKGHGRLMALKKLGWQKAAIDVQDYENEAQEYSDLIADNRIAELAEFDEKMMVDEIKLLGIEDFELLGLDDFDLDKFALDDSDLSDEEKLKKEQELIANESIPWAKELDEKTDYIMLLFKDRKDFVAAQEKLKLPSIKHNISASETEGKGFLRQGICRLIDGKGIIDEL